MSVTLRVAAVQAAADLDPVVNRERLGELVPADTDLVLFPEAYARDFGPAGSDVSGYAEPTDGPFATELAAVAAARGTTAVAGTFEPSEDPGRPYNTLVVRGGVAAEYRKVHLYDSFGYRESDRLRAGPVAPVVIEVPTASGATWRVGLMTCYDLRFPEFARLLVDAGAEVLLVPSAWLPGERKVDHWRTLLRARAIENTVFVVAAGQAAPRYVGHSMVLDPWGDVLAEAGEEPTTLHAVLDRASLEEARRTNPSLANRRL